MPAKLKWVRAGKTHNPVRMEKCSVKELIAEADRLLGIDA
jgi:hypothetical protein